MSQTVFNSKDLRTLGPLSDPMSYQNPISVVKNQLQLALELYERMLLIRLIEESIGSLVDEGDAKCPCHLAIGQEAIAVGVCRSLTSTDAAYGGHRSHGHYLALGGDGYKLLAEVLGKEDGCSKGMGGSMHLYAPEVGFRGSVPIVGATIPIAVGAALAFKLAKGQNVAVTFFGDGAAEEGVLHESLNLASVHNLPVLFVCENNLYSSHLDIKLRQPNDVVSRFALAHHIESFVVDGNDVLEVERTTRELVKNMRESRRPAFLEAITYRHRGHVGPDANIDVGVRRSQVDVLNWRKRDPIVRLRQGITQGFPEKGGLMDEMEENMNAVIAGWIQQARLAPYPEVSGLLSRVYI